MKRIILILISLILITHLVHSSPKIGAIAVSTGKSTTYKTILGDEVEIQLDPGTLYTIYLDTGLGKSIYRIEGISSNKYKFNRFYLKILPLETYSTVKVIFREDPLVKPLIALIPGNWISFSSPVSLKANSSYRLTFREDKLYAVKVKLTILSRHYFLEFNSSSYTIAYENATRIEVNGVEISATEVELVVYGDTLTIINKDQDLVLFIAYCKFYYKDVTEGSFLEKCFIVYDSKLVNLKLNGTYLDSNDPFTEEVPPEPIKCIKVEKAIVEKIEYKERIVELRAVDSEGNYIGDAIIEVGSSESIFRAKGKACFKTADLQLLVKVYLYGTLSGEYLVSTEFSPLDIPLKLYQVSLDVVDSNMKPIDKAVVQLYSYLSLIAKNTTVVDGKALFKNLPAGVYLIKIFYGGKEVARKSIVVERSIQEIVVCNLADLKIKVKDSESLPVPEVSVILFDESTGRKICEDMTNNEGEVCFKEIVFGKYRVVLHYLFKNYTFSIVHENKFIELEIPLKSVKILLFDKFSNNIKSTRVELYHGDLKIAEATPDERGIVVFSRIPEGEYTLKISCIGGVEEKTIKIVSKSAVIAIYLDVVSVFGKPIKTEILKVSIAILAGLLFLVFILKLKKILSKRRKIKPKKVIIVEE
ncbi:MAG: hypothetical protein DRN04_04730 [Thermoprotei archaeon]|nr:MAG: hypothetical protein DRN04_04730 [Thermoprotei archaeon]